MAFVQCGAMQLNGNSRLNGVLYAAEPEIENGLTICDTFLHGC